MGATATPVLTTSGCSLAWRPRAPPACRPSTSASSAHAELGAWAIQWAAAGQTETSRARPATAAATTRTDLLRNAAAIASRHRGRGRTGGPGLRQAGMQAGAAAQAEAASAAGVALEDRDGWDLPRGPGLLSGPGRFANGGTARTDCRSVLRRPRRLRGPGLLRGPGDSAGRGCCRRTGAAPGPGLLRRPGRLRRPELLRRPGGSAGRGCCGRPGGIRRPGWFRRPGRFSTGRAWLRRPGLPGQPRAAGSASWAAAYGAEPSCWTESSLRSGAASARARRTMGAVNQPGCTTRACRRAGTT